MTFSSNILDRWRWFQVSSLIFQIYYISKKKSSLTSQCKVLLRCQECIHNIREPPSISAVIWSSFLCNILSLSILLGVWISVALIDGKSESSAWVAQEFVGSCMIITLYSTHQHIAHSEWSKWLEREIQCYISVACYSLHYGPPQPVIQTVLFLFSFLSHYGY